MLGPSDSSYGDTLDKEDMEHTATVGDCGTSTRCSQANSQIDIESRLGVVLPNSGKSNFVEAFI